MNDIDTLIENAAAAVARDMERRAPSASDGIWRFDRVVEEVLGKDHAKEVWQDIERRARAKNARKDTWDRAGFGIVASFAQTKAAYATPGFAEARRKFMS